jgi:soluble lytic murein transglycosylase
LTKLLPPIWVALPLLVLILHCSSTPPSEGEQATARVFDPSNLSPEELATFKLATEFDRYLMKQMKEAEIAEYKEKCAETNPSPNPFCHTVLNREKLEQAKIATRPTPARKPRPLVPKLRKGKIANWFDLRFASVSSIIRGLASVHKLTMLQVKELALNEKKCPNHAVVAIAAHLEDLLPDRISLRELGDLYARAAECPSDVEVAQDVYLSRAGIFYFAAGDYRKAKAVLSRGAVLEKTFRARSLYWLHRTLMQLGEKKEAEEALTNLFDEYPFAFHSLVAMTAEGKDPGEVLDRKNGLKVTRSKKNDDLNHLIEQHEILQKFQFEKSAAKILNLALQNSEDVEPELKVYLAELKGTEGDHLSNFSILTEVLYRNPQLISRETMEQYFPTHYFPIFEKHSQGLDPYFLLAIARRESAFNPKAISHANARGLLQLLPQTSRDLNMKKDLLNPEENVFVGAYYVSELLNRVNGQIHFALAAYNAGPLRLDEWTSRYPINDPILFVDLIPFRETREYVAAVLRNYYWYRRIHKNDPATSVPLTFNSKN